MSEPAAPRKVDVGNIVRRLTGIAWQYRWDCMRLLGLQLLLTTLTVVVLALAGAGIDVVLHATDSTAPVSGLTQWLFDNILGDAGLVACYRLAGLILVLALLRAGLSFVYGIKSVEFLHGRVVVGMRARVYTKLQQLSFRFFDANASSESRDCAGSVIGDVDQKSTNIHLDVIKTISRSIANDVNFAVNSLGGHC